jgi:hypothetical protein
VVSKVFPYYNLRVTNQGACLFKNMFVIRKTMRQNLVFFFFLKLREEMIATTSLWKISVKVDDHGLKALPESVLELLAMKMPKLRGHKLQVLGH